MCALQATCRWALTGTPLQNKLDDLASLFQFLRAYPYNDACVFNEHVRRLRRSYGDSVAISRLKQAIRCLMLRRSIGTVDLPERTDVVCRLEFNPEEKEVYERAKFRTLSLLNTALENEESNTQQLNVLQWINDLRMICNQGVLAKVASKQGVCDETNTSACWEKATAQASFNSLVTAGSAKCSMCSRDLEDVTTEVSDKASSGCCQPQLSSCLCLICGPCCETMSNQSQTCGHQPAHPFLKVSTMSSNTQEIQQRYDSASQMPTKVKALLRDIQQHMLQEKW